MIRFDNTELLYLLFIIPLLVLLFVFYRVQRKKVLLRLADKGMLNRLAPDVSTFKNTFRFILYMIAIASVIVGLANPQIGTKLEEVKREGVEIIIAVDVSNSMLARDLKPSRLERARSSILRLIDNLKSDKIGLVLFAGDAFLQLPLTTDYSAAKLMVNSISTDMIEKQGTAIGNAIELSTDAFSENESINKVLVIITDGENHEDDALSAVEEATQKGIIVNTIGMGSVEGSPIPRFVNGKEQGYIKSDGKTVVSKLNAQMLQELAVKGDGEFIRAGVSTELIELVEKIGELEKTEFESKVFTDYEDRFQYLFAFAFALILIESMIGGKKNKIISLRNILGDKE